MDNTCVLVANCRESLYPEPRGNVSPIQVAVVKKLREPGSFISGAKTVSSAHPNLLGSQGRSFRPYTFLGRIGLENVLGVEEDSGSGTLRNARPIFINVHVLVDVPIIDKVSGWIALQRLIPGPDYALLRERFPQLPLWENWPR